jgi:hypothetical protein
MPISKKTVFPNPFNNQLIQSIQNRKEQASMVSKEISKAPTEDSSVNKVDAEKV